MIYSLLDKDGAILCERERGGRFIFSWSNRDEMFDDAVRCLGHYAWAVLNGYVTCGYAYDVRYLQVNASGPIAISAVLGHMEAAGENVDYYARLVDQLWAELGISNEAKPQRLALDMPQLFLCLPAPGG